MVWKQDLAKLKKELVAEEGPAPKAPPPKPTPKPLESRPIEDEDAMFLAAMGGRSRPSAPRSVPTVEVVLPPPPVPAPAPLVENFQEAMGSLKGLKRMATEGPSASTPPKAVAVPIPPPPRPEPEPEPIPPAPAAPEVQPMAVATPIALPTSPQLIHLAAGMAVEVDGSLDLRGHSPEDALERLRERIQDGLFLGWRTLHVNLGPDPAVKEAFLAHLGTTEGRAISRYAQAPIPMGGSQAWILYFNLQPSTQRSEPA